jgi:hypothetical protein
LREECRLKVFQKRMLSKIFQSKSDEVMGEWRRQHNEELNDLYCSPNIVRVIKLRGMRWAEHVTRVVRGEVCTGFWWGKPEGKRLLAVCVLSPHLI